VAVLVLAGPVDLADVPALCERVGELLEDRGAELVDCDVGSLRPDAVTVEALARMQLEAHRRGRRVRFRHACGELQDLLSLMGLSDVLPCEPPSGIEARRKAEQREQARRVQEERDAGDPVA
jgi:ABC-type transporter Mla MlaB component